MAQLNRAEKNNGIYQQSLLLPLTHKANDILQLIGYGIQYSIPCFVYFKS